jgi:hypothetical protein
MTDIAVPDLSVEQSLEYYAASSAEVGSPLYGVLLTGLLADYRSGGITADMLDGVSDRPFPDAIPLRYAAAGHRLALTGDAPRLAPHYPSCGGQWDGSEHVVTDFLATVRGNQAEFRAGMRRNVQTNEVARAAVLASGFSLIVARHGSPIDQLEIGSSAGLLSRWDHFAYDTGESTGGMAGSSVRFGPEWWIGERKPLLVPVEIAFKRASDISPIDVSTSEGRVTMLSFVWPDQLERVERLRRALQIAAAVPIEVERADAGEWLERQLAHGLESGRATVLFHSIVWQYLPRQTKDRIKAVLAATGSTATDDGPLLWLRMEPANREHANLRLTTWPGGQDESLAEVGYHGVNIRWLGDQRSG